MLLTPVPCMGDDANQCVMTGLEHPDEGVPLAIILSDAFKGPMQRGAALIPSIACFEPTTSGMATGDTGCTERVYIGLSGHHTGLPDRNGVNSQSRQDL